ncbi:hypothetical protein LTR85_003436 [Meristemomyces frigidus]|nr:hypothetical protein LTR85_003436 [Meristemomyces frigidus]
MAWRPCKAASLGRAFLLVVTFWLLSRALWSHHGRRPVGPLTKEVIENGGGVGGRWYIPPSWLQRMDSRGTQCSSLTANSSILDAAECAFRFAVHEHAFLNDSHIPLITHQTWRNLEPETWNDVVRGCVEDWLRAATGDDSAQGPAMAYFLWDDDGIAQLMEQYEPKLTDAFNRLPYPVEKSDVFRVTVLKWFGGLYADVDARPLQHPYGWVHPADLTPWTDAASGAEFTMHAPHTEAYTVPSNVPVSYSTSISPDDQVALGQLSVNAIFGIGADNLPDPDPTYWRMGYTYPIQTTNWALCMAPHHPIANQYLATLNESIWLEGDNLIYVDPLDITGPPALTAAVKAVALREDPELSWNALSGRHGDPVGGRGKVVAGDALILPITGFSPGRGWFHNMGSQSVAHPNARLRHAAVGSWRKIDVKVHYGKLCRVVFGRCKDWKKIPDP